MPPSCTNGTAGSDERSCRHWSRCAAVVAHFDAGGHRSPRAERAVVTSTDPEVVGARRVGLRFAAGGVEQHVPMAYVRSGAGIPGPLLPDNAMHRAPLPAVHLLRRRDLAAVAAALPGDELAALELRNAARVRALSWEGLAALAAGARPAEQGWGSAA